MRVEIISIGEELLSGDSDIIDTNSIYITKQLAAVGLRVLYKTTVGDDEQRITDVIKLALSRADIIVTTGGLGPTVDDMTRQGVANAIGCRLETRQELLDQLAEKFARFGVQMTENNRGQATVPEGCIALNNAVGTAPGFIVEYEGKAIISVPGVPREMKYLMENAVLPYLAEKFGATGLIKVRVLRTAGIGESMIDDQIGDLEKLANPTVGLAAHSGQTDIRIYARAKTEAEADKLIAGVESEVRKRMGSYIYGTDKELLEYAFVEMMLRAGRQVAFIEAGTNGQLRKRIENHPQGMSIIAFGESLSSVHEFTLRAAAFNTNISATQLSSQGDQLTEESENKDSGDVSSDKDIYLYQTQPDTPSRYKALSESIAKQLETMCNTCLRIVIISDEQATAVTVVNGAETLSRTYAYGGAGVGGPEWSTGWALSMGWHIIAASINTDSIDTSSTGTH